ncbi:hypothetical protein NFI96_012217, partial [Prochilodus magdalenae]
EMIYCRDTELLAVSLRPYYMRRELSYAIPVYVYVPHREDAETTCDVIHATIARLQSQHPHAFIAISGRTGQLIYTNVKDAYTATPLPPMKKPDHNLVYLQPQYKPRARTQPITTCSFRKSPGAETTLRDCFESTEWSVLQVPYGEDIEGLTHCMTIYMNFCMDGVVPVKPVPCSALDY